MGRRIGSPLPIAVQTWIELSMEAHPEPALALGDREHLSNPAVVPKTCLLMLRLYMIRCNTTTLLKGRDHLLGCRFPLHYSAPSPSPGVCTGMSRAGPEPPGTWGSLHEMGRACLGRGGHGIPCPLQQRGRGKEEGRKERRKRKEQDRHRSISRQAGSSAPDTQGSLAHHCRAAMLGHSPVAGCQQSTEQEGSCTKKRISLLKAGHLATLMKSALVSGSALSTLFYFCPRARFSYYKQDFQS